MFLTLFQKHFGFFPSWKESVSRDLGRKGQVSPRERAVCGGSVLSECPLPPGPPASPPRTSRRHDHPIAFRAPRGGSPPGHRLAWEALDEARATPSARLPGGVAGTAWPSFGWAGRSGRREAAPRPGLLEGSTVGAWALAPGVGAPVLSGPGRSMPPAILRHRPDSGLSQRPLLRPATERFPLYSSSGLWPLGEWL